MDHNYLKALICDTVKGDFVPSVQFIDPSQCLALHVHCILHQRPSLLQLARKSIHVSTVMPPAKVLSVNNPQEEYTCVYCESWLHFFKKKEKRKKLLCNAKPSGSVVSSYSYNET